MSNIIQFPIKEKQDWDRIEKAIIDLLQQSSAYDESIKVILDRMKIAWEEHQFSYPLSVTVPDASAQQVRKMFDGFRKAFQDFHCKLLLSRLKLEIEIAKLKGLS
jgi:hypothetical protein